MRIRLATCALIVICFGGLVGCNEDRKGDDKTVKTFRVARIFTVVPFGAPTPNGNEADFTIASTNLGAGTDHCDAGKLVIAFAPTPDKLSSIITYSVSNLSLGATSALEISIIPLAKPVGTSLTFGTSYEGLVVDHNSEIDFPVTAAGTQNKTFPIKPGSVQGAIVVETCDY